MSLRYTIGKKEHAIEFLNWVDKNYNKTFLGYISKTSNPYRIGITAEEVYEKFLDLKSFKKESIFPLSSLNKLQRKTLIEFINHKKWNPFELDEKIYKTTIKSLFYKKLITCFDTKEGIKWEPTALGIGVYKRLENRLQSY